MTSKHQNLWDKEWEKRYDEAYNSYYEKQYEKYFKSNTHYNLFISKRLLKLIEKDIKSMEEKSNAISKNENSL